MFQPILVAGIHELGNGVVDIFLDGVVHRVLSARGAGAVIVHTQSAADIHKVDIKTGLAQMHIELHCLAECILDAADLRDLAPDVEVDQLQ